MKILPVEKIREADAFTIKNEPIAGIDLMERAATECFYWLMKAIPHDKKIHVFCGTGNNGGDGLAIARLLSGKGYHLRVYLCGNPERLSPDCNTNLTRLQVSEGRFTNGTFHVLDENGQLPEISNGDVVIDAILGSGLSKPVSGFFAEVIGHINHSGAVVVAVDVPSGLLCDTTNFTTPTPAIVRADYTLTFSPPKLALFFPENDAFFGNWQLLDIGIMPEFIEKTEVLNEMLTPEHCRHFLKKRNKFAHKGNFGHALLVCGGLGKMGAAVLAARACLRSGAGLVTVRVPKSGISILQSAVPEAMLSVDFSDDIFSEVPNLTPYTSIAIGPGIGQSDITARALKHLIQTAGIPLLLDADAINILAANKTWLAFLPKGCIFTPHPREFERLAGKSSNDYDRNRLQREFSFKYHCFVVLKGAHTAITTPDGHCYFNSTGNPGMASGGSGDVLTGIIAGLMAQGYSSLESCLLGVYVHGHAGDLALSETGFEALIAGDIIKNQGKAFQSLYGKF